MKVQPTTSLPADTMVGSYRLLGQIGRGGMGTVYRAEQVSLQREVAVKILHPKRMVDPRAVDSFLREAQIAAALSHHHLVPVYDVGFDEILGVHYYAMKYVSGRTLSTVVAQEGPISLDNAIILMEQVGAALGHAHNQGIVHRDLKPGNIILSDSGQAIVTDLGLAMDRLADQTSASKRILKLVGTAEYAAPEQLRNPDRATAAADVWAMGATLYYLLTGSEPFNGETLLDLVVAVATEEPPLMAGLPAEAQRLLAHFMAKDPARRPPNGHAAQGILETLRRPAQNAGALSIQRRRPVNVARATVARRRRR
ncbi:MAG: serine/threonine protein kinase [Planctomycetota bacterium]|nr:MAG: serine/threonine protein kinase [Planctomycetota bacterium]